MTEEKKEEVNEKKVVETPKSTQPQPRQLVILTDGANIQIVKNELSILELHEVGRQLMNAQVK